MQNSHGRENLPPYLLWKDLCDMKSSRRNVVDLMVGVLQPYRAMRRGALVLIAGVATACGGSVVHGGTVDGASGSGTGVNSGPGSGTGVNSGSGSASSDAAPMCDVPPDTGQESCVMCSGEWHCSGGTVMPQCASGFAGAGTCAGNSACLACTSAGRGTSWSCTNSQWSTTPELIPCSQ